MNIFVAGGTGVLGRAAVPALVAAGHRVRSTARGSQKAALVRQMGAEPVEVDLYSPASVRQAIAGCEAVIRITTRIPPLAQMRQASAWQETNRLRTEGARILVDAAIAERASLYVHESVTFVYQDGGANWLTEDSAVDDGGAQNLRAALDGEKEAARFTDSGGRGLVLRFAGFYGEDVPSALDTIQMARKRLLFQIGSGANYFSSIYIPDAGRAVAAALGIPAGTYNIADDEPVPFAEYVRLITESSHSPNQFHLPAFTGKWIFGDLWRYFSRSQRVSNRRFREAAGWQPNVRSVSEGWPLIAGKLASQAA